MNFDFDAPLERRGTGSNKWSRYPADVLPMWVADMDFAVAPSILAALAERLSHPVFGYAAAGESLREAIVAHCLARYGWGIRPADIVFLPGVEPGFNMALKCLAEPGDGVVVNTPVYRPILNAPGHWGLQRLDLPLVDGEPGFDPSTLAALLRRARVYLLCNPHNPLGKVFRRSELEAIAAGCVANDVWIVSDEIHCDLVYGGLPHLPIAALDAEVAKRTVTLMAASKTFNIAGLKTAFAIIPNPVLRQRFEAARLGMVDSVNVFGLVATQAALTHGEAWRQALVRYLQGNRDFLEQALRTRLPGVRMVRPEATFLAWLDCASLPLDGDAQPFFLERAQVALSTGSEFGEQHGKWVRLNFGCPRARLAEAIDRMVTSLG
jgi:cystathionine beta-lyase